jgi:Predicted SAM-dependent methyltransferase
MDKRLTAIANCVALTLLEIPDDLSVPDSLAPYTEPPAVADIGTDHGKLAVYLAKTYGCTVYAGDIAEGPLSACKQLVVKSKVSDKVVPVLCDGLADIPSHVGTVVIAGLGGETIAEIIDKSPFCLSGKTLVLSPHSHEDRLLGYLSDNNFVTLQRETVQSKKKNYIVLMVRK